MLGTDERFELNQETLTADVDVKWVERFHLVELVAANVALAEWGHAEIHECIPERHPAEPALWLAGGCYVGHLAPLPLSQSQLVKVS